MKFIAYIRLCQWCNMQHQSICEFIAWNWVHALAARTFSFSLSLSPPFYELMSGATTTDHAVRSNSILVVGLQFTFEYRKDKRFDFADICALFVLGHIDAIVPLSRQTNCIRMCMRQTAQRKEKTSQNTKSRFHDACVCNWARFDVYNCYLSIQNVKWQQQQQWPEKTKQKKHSNNNHDISAYQPM